MEGKRVKLNSTAVGTCYILVTAFCFALMSLLVRLAGDLPAIQKAFFRNVIAAIIAVPMLFRSEEKFRIHPGCLPDLFFRALLGTVGVVSNFWAVDHIGIADANVLNRLAPFFAVVMSAFLLKEKPGKVDILCVIAAFCGAVFLVRPGAGLIRLPALVGVLGGLCAGTASTFVRRLGQRGERGSMIVAFFSCFSCLISLPFLLFDFHPMTGRQWLLLLSAGAAGGVGQLCLTRAYRAAPAREISIFDYTQALHGAWLGAVFLGEIPGRSSIIGYCIIIGSAVFRYFYNRRLHHP